MLLSQRQTDNPEFPATLWVKVNTYAGFFWLCLKWRKNRQTRASCSDFPVISTWRRTSSHRCVAGQTIELASPGNTTIEMGRETERKLIGTHLREEHIIRSFSLAVKGITLIPEHIFDLY